MSSTAFTDTPMALAMKCCNLLLSVSAFTARNLPLFKTSNLAGASGMALVISPVKRVRAADLGLNCGSQMWSFLKFPMCSSGSLSRPGGRLS